MKRFFFNNCKRRRHAILYPLGAFYDLNQFGRQAKMATDLSPGDECIVATPTEDGDVEFAWFSFTYERIMEMPDEPDSKVRVQFGERIRSECLPKSEAVSTGPYSAFFNIKGQFKRASVIKPK